MGAGLTYHTPHLASTMCHRYIDPGSLCPCSHSNPHPMPHHEPNPSTTSERGTSIALIFALLAERLHFHYEHDKWLNQAQCAALAADWLARSKRALPLQARKDLAYMSELLAKQISDSASREAGLYISHELQEALDPRYYSELGQTMMLECEMLFDEYCKQNANKLNDTIDPAL